MRATSIRPPEEGVMSAKVLMPVFNEIDYDGRVQRAAEAIGQHFDVTVCSIQSNQPYHNSLFRTKLWKRPTGLRKLHVALFSLWFILTSIRSRPGVIYAHDYFMAFPGWIASKLTGSLYVYDAHELIIPDQGEELGKRQRFFFYLEKWVVHRADKVIAANEERARIMQQFYKLTASPLVVRNIPPAAKQIVKQSAAKKDFADKEFEPDPNEPDFKLVYQGDMSLERGLLKFLLAFKHLPSRYKLFLIGGGTDLPRIKELVAAEGLQESVHIVGKVTRDKLQSMLPSFDIGIISYPYKGLNNIYCAPNKLYEYTQAGLAVIATDQPPLKYSIEYYQLGAVVAVDADKPDAVAAKIAGAIEQIAENLPVYQSNLGRFVEEHNWENEKEKLIGEFNKFNLSHGNLEKEQRIG